MTFLKEDLNKIIQAIKKLADSGQESNTPEQEIVESDERHYLSDDLALIAQAIRDLNENNEITVEKSKYLSENLNEIAQAIEDLNPSSDSTEKIKQILSRTITNLKIPEGLTKIGKAALANCEELKTVEFPSTITEIEDEAFLNALTLNIDLETNFPTTLTKLGKKAFYNTAIADNNNKFYYNSSAVIEDSAFFPLNNYTSVEYGDNVIEITNIIKEFGGFNEKNHFTNAKIIKIGNNVKTINDFAFSGCYALTDLKLGNSITDIGESAFRDCNNLTSLSLPNSLINIGAYAFAGSNSLTTIILPQSITRIENGGFYQGKESQLTTIIFPNTITYIGDQAFYINLFGIAENIKLKLIDLTAFNENDEVPQLGTAAFKFYHTSGDFAIPDFDIIFKNQATLEKFANASNWSEYAEHFKVAE